jgi:RNA polymerase sigma-70 factor (ECF subfamily)
VIKTPAFEHGSHEMVSVPLDDEVVHGDAPSADKTQAQARITSITLAHFDFIWRCLRRLGVQQPGVDDAAQEVFEVATRKLDRIEPGRERAFLFKTAMLVAQKARRLAFRAKERDGGDPDLLPQSSRDPEALSLAMERRQLLDRALEGLNDELRTVFVLFELEGLRTREIADLLDVPMGTIASRLRRAREAFHDRAEELRKEQRRVP